MADIGKIEAIPVNAVEGLPVGVARLLGRIGPGAARGWIVEESFCIGAER